jgi:subtilase family serine protease
VLACLAVLLIASPAFSQSAADARTLPNTQILGAEDPTKQITVAFWLKQHDKAGFDELVRQMYDKNSPNYHHWLTVKEYEARFAPSAADMAVVRQHLAAHNLKVVSTDKLNHAVTARGSVADVERAAGVQLNRASINGVEHRVPAAEAVVPGAAGKVVAAVQGLSDLKYENYARRMVDPDTGKPVAIPLSTAPATTTKFFNAACLRGTETRVFKTNGGSPTATYAGSRYGGIITDVAPNLPPCGYDAYEVQVAYGLKPLYNQRLNGNGQVVVLVDAYGSDTILADANAFSQINGLPTLNGNNFEIFYPTGATNCGGNTCGWDLETSLDVEWSHTVAPEAFIALVLGADASFTNLDLAVLFAVETGLGPVISNSYGIGEIVLQSYDPQELIVENNIFETAAALGISVNFSSGDDGDFSVALGTTTVSAAAASPYATGVGGTSLFLNGNNSIKLQTGWGNNITRIATYPLVTGGPNPPLVPPTFEGFDAGAGGGTSAVWSKPSFQGKLPGTWRLVPDIAYLADPFTGAEFVDTEGGTQSIGVVGGTSLACPMFSGMWAIAVQAAGGNWLGQAAPILYGLPASAITDVIATNAASNASGTTYATPSTPVSYTPAELVAPVETTSDFLSLLYQGTSTRWYALSFGTDTSLNVGPGWDNVTGLGTPNGANFVTAVAAAK